MNNTNIYGVSEDFSEIQTVDIGNGRYLNETEFKREIRVLSAMRNS